MPKEKQKLNNEKDTAQASAPLEQSKDLRILAAIGYLWILCLLPLLSKKDSEFVQHHAKQGLVLTIASFAVGLIWWIPIIGFFASLCGIGLIVFAVMGIRSALEGEYWEMPMLGKYAQQIKL